MSNDSKVWFAARTRRNQEKTIKAKLEQIGVEHFIPFRQEIRCRNDRKVKVWVPVIPNVVFVYESYHRCLSIVNDYGLKMWYMRAIDGNGLLLVPQKQMDDFRCLCENDIEFAVSQNFTKGDKVKVVSGSLAGLEGELISCRKNNGRIVLKLEGIVAFELVISMDNLEKI